MGVLNYFGVCLLTFVFVAKGDANNVTIPDNVDSTSTVPNEPAVVSELLDTSINIISQTSTDPPDSVGPPSRTYFRNVMRVNNIRRSGRTFYNGENTLESPIRPTASAQEYPRGTGVGSFAEVGLSITKSADSRNGRSYAGATEASVSSASYPVTSLMTMTAALFLLVKQRIGAR